MALTSILTYSVAVLLLNANTGFYNGPVAFVSADDSPVLLEAPPKPKRGILRDLDKLPTIPELNEEFELGNENSASETTPESPKTMEPSEDVEKANVEAKATDTTENTPVDAESTVSVEDAPAPATNDEPLVTDSDTKVVPDVSEKEAEPSVSKDDDKEQVKEVAPKEPAVEGPYVLKNLSLRAAANNARKTLYTKPKEKVKELGKKAGKAIKKTSVKAGEKVKEVSKKAGKSIKKTSVETKEKVKEVSKKARKSIKKTSVKAGEKVKEVGKKAGKSIKNTSVKAARTAATKTKDAAVKVAGKVKKTTEDTSRRVKDYVKNKYKSRVSGKVVITKL